LPRLGREASASTPSIPTIRDASSPPT
jgi:hypothetical protein